MLNKANAEVVARIGTGGPVVAAEAAGMVDVVAALLYLPLLLRGFLTQNRDLDSGAKPFEGQEAVLSRDLGETGHDARGKVSVAVAVRPLGGDVYINCKIMFFQIFILFGEYPIFQNFAYIPSRVQIRGFTLLPHDLLASINRKTLRLML